MVRLKFRSISLVLEIVLCWLLSFGSWAGETHLVVERAWLEDATGQLSWDDVRERNMTPYEGVLTLGYSAKPVWLRLRIDPALARAENAHWLYLRIRPLYLDEIILYDPLQDPPQRPPLGDLFPVSEQSEPSNTFLHQLPLGDGPREIWLRVQTTSTRLIYPEVMTSVGLRLSESRINLFGASYLGLIGIFFLWGIIQLIIQPDRLMIAFLFHQAAALLLGSSHLGFSYLYLSDALPIGAADKMFNVLNLLVSSAGVIFSHYLLNELGFDRRRNNFFGLVLLIYLVLLFAVWNGQVMQALTVNMLLILVLPFIFLGFAYQCKPVAPAEGTPGLSKIIVVGYFSITLIFTLMAALPVLGLVKGTLFTIYIFFMYTISTGFLMVLLLQYRAWRSIRRQSLMLAMTHEAQKRANEEKAQRQERERMLAMLGHELKTPLSVIRMMMADRALPTELARRIGASVDDMAHVVERAVQSGQLEAGRIVLNVQPGNLLKLTRSVLDTLPAGDRIGIESAGDTESEIHADLELLKVVLRNLVDNALKYSPPEARVEVLLNQPDASGNWSVVVSNPIGRAGLPDPKHVFEKFYRSPKASYRSGSGLGLYLVHGIAEVMGGSLRYESNCNSVCFILSMQYQPKGDKP